MFIDPNNTRLVGKYNVELSSSNELIFHACLLVNSHSEKIRIKIIISWGGPPLDALIRLRDPSSPTAEMGTKMKGLIKGLRYISQIFGDDSSSEEEEEMQIGNPTDVKHVAHIGWDGPSVVHNSPSWMDGFSKSTPPQPELPRDNPEIQKLSDPPKQTKKSRRRNSAAVSMNSPTQDLLEGTKPSRRNKNLSDGAVVQNSSSARETPSVPIPKQSKKKKSKDSSVGGSTRSRRKDCSTLTCTASSDDPGSGGP